MGTFAETTNVDYRLSFADQGNKLPFSISFAENKWKFAVSIFRLQQINRRCCFPSVLFSVSKYTYLSISIFIYVLPNGKRKPKQFS
jgi:hypothetical protein